MICTCSGIIMLIVPLFTFNGSTLEDILQGYPREKRRRLKDKRKKKFLNQEDKQNKVQFRILLKILKHAVL